MQGAWLRVLDAGSPHMCDGVVTGGGWGGSCQNVTIHFFIKTLQTLTAGYQCIEE